MSAHSSAAAATAPRPIRRRRRRRRPSARRTSMRRCRSRGSIPDGRGGSSTTTLMTHPMARARRCRSRPGAPRASAARRTPLAPAPATSRIKRSTSSADPPSSAWMKLACFSETRAVPTRKPLRPASSMRRPAESPSGFVNTEPAFCPPGWFAAAPAHDGRDLFLRLCGVAGTQREARPTRRCRTGRSRSVDTRGPDGPPPPPHPSRCRDRRRGPSARPAATSEPWPPAFMRTAPPIEPGTPTAHSRPRSPAAAVVRARTGRLTAPPARTVASSTSIAGEVAPRASQQGRRSRRPRRACSSHARGRRSRHPTRDAARCTSSRSCSSSIVNDAAAVPPTR